MKRLTSFALLAGLGALAFAAGPVHARAWGEAEQLVLRAFNLCWDAEQGGNLAKLAAAKGFVNTPQSRSPVYHRDSGDAVVFLSADYGPGADGAPEPACRITVVRPQVDTSYNPRRPVLPSAAALMDEIVRVSTGKMGYQMVASRQPHPRRAGHVRTILKAGQGGRGKLIYVEQGPTHYEFLYVHAMRSVIDDPGMPDMAIDPRGRAPLQAYVDDRWTIAFCNLNPHACETPQQRQARIAAEQAQASARSSSPIPFSGIGSSGARSLSATEKDYYDNIGNARNPYVIRERR